MLAATRRGMRKPRYQSAGGLLIRLVGWVFVRTDLFGQSRTSLEQKDQENGTHGADMKPLGG